MQEFECYKVWSLNESRYLHGQFSTAYKVLLQLQAAVWHGPVKTEIWQGTAPYLVTEKTVVVSNLLQVPS